MDYTNAILYPIDAKSIKFENVGTFQVTIIVQDQENNVTIKSFDVVVSPKGGK